MELVELERGLYQNLNFGLPRKLLCQQYCQDQGQTRADQK